MDTQMEAWVEGGYRAWGLGIRSFAHDSAILVGLSENEVGS